MNEAPLSSVDKYQRQLAENESLRDQLTPEQSQQLLQWGQAQLGLRAGSPDNELQEAADAVGRLLRQVNGISPMLAYLVEDEQAEDLALAFVGSVAELTGRTLDDAWIDDLVSSRGGRDEAATFSHLLKTLQALTGE